MSGHLYPLLKETPGINFVGNVEGRDLFFDKSGGDCVRRLCRQCGP